MKQAAGTLLYRIGEAGLLVMLVHPSGNYNRKAPWSIPKGELEPGEMHEMAARRETEEETGVRAADLVALGSIRYTKSPKEIWCFAGPLPADAIPQCASWEVDSAELLPIDSARAKIHPDQAVLIDRLLDHLQALKSNEPVAG